MKKLLISLMAVVVAVGLVGSAFAYFSDTEESTDNTFTAGYLDMQMSKGAGWQNPYSGPLATVSNLAPGEVTQPYGMYLRNIGNISGKVKVTFSYSESDVDLDDQVGEFANIDKTDFAKYLIVKSAKLDADPDNKAPYWVSLIVTAGLYSNEADAEADGAIYLDGLVYVPTIYGLSIPGVELKFYPAHPTEEEWTQNEQHYEEWTFMMDPEADSDYMFDGVDIMLTATMIQYDAPWE